MGKQNKRKSTESISTELPTKGKGGPATPKKEVASAKKVKIHAFSPKALKNKPMNTPVKQKTPNKNAAETNNGTPKKKNLAAKKGKTNGAAKEMIPPKPKHSLIPEEISKKMNRRQRMRVAQKISKVLKQQGREDFSKIDPNDASIKEIVDKLVKTDNTETKANKSVETKAKVIKQIVAAQAEDTDNETAAKTPKKTPKKSLKN